MCKPEDLVFVWEVEYVRKFELVSLGECRWELIQLKVCVFCVQLAWIIEALGSMQ